MTPSFPDTPSRNAPALPHAGVCTACSTMNPPVPPSSPVREVRLYPHFSDGKIDLCRLTRVGVKKSRESDSGQEILHIKDPQHRCPHDDDGVSGGG